ncbi:hypothetical protein GKR41_00549 [Candidatus Vallotia lariciata]|nr:hypothetical protein GKR41_00549 [Candidatus Vallotia lariciata]
MITQHVFCLFTMLLVIFISIALLSVLPLFASLDLVRAGKVNVLLFPCTDMISVGHWCSDI